MNSVGRGPWEPSGMPTRRILPRLERLSRSLHFLAMESTRGGQRANISYEVGYFAIMVISRAFQVGHGVLMQG